MKFQRLLGWLLVWALLLTSVLPPGVRAAPSGQFDSPETRARALLGTLSPEERVGQLFLVTFKGTDIGVDSPIYDLISNYHIGGVILRADNDNFSAPPDTIDSLYQLTAGLQNIAWTSSLDTRPDPLTGQTHRNAFVPLWIGLSQLGGGFPQDQILSGLSDLPSPMALGAAWDPDLARQVGQVLGSELWAMGINMYLGPSLDVLSEPDASSPGDPGTTVFGGDPFWVGRLGQAYINGLHTGSQDRLLVVAEHFPGRGLIDRDPDEEIPTVRRSLEQLNQIELAPFAAVTGLAPDESAQADALLVSHIRYQGFQGNIRATTRPVSLDAQALDSILGQESFAAWRQNGGLLVSDELGTQAVQSFYDPRGGAFNAALVARDAFLAGNDLLYMGNIRSSDADNTHDSLVAALEFFAKKYREDSVFAQRVDETVLRILTAKYRTYPAFVYSGIVPPQTALSAVGESRLDLQSARESATLVSPDLDTLDDVMAGGPKGRESILFITDTQIWQQCSTCPAQVALGQNDLEQAVLRLYGLQAGAQISAAYLKSYTFGDLEQLLNGQNLDFTADLIRARWVVLATGNMSQEPDAYLLLQRFLTERQDVLRDKRVVLFNFGAPYALDSTDISKLTAYYSLYSLSPAFIETAVRLLFQEFVPSGALPVSVPGIGYDIITATSPDPDQVITLDLDVTASESATEPASEAAAAATNVPFFKVGDTVQVSTGTILDHNGHIVPDGTVVTFNVLRHGEDSGILQQIQAETRQGVAETSLRLDSAGLLEITASSEPAVTSVTLQINVSDAGGSLVVIAPTPVATPTRISPTATVPPETEATPTAPGPAPAGETAPVYLFLVLLAGMLVAFWIGLRAYGLRWGMRWALLAGLAGLIVLNWMVWARMPANAYAGVLVGEGLGLWFGWLWQRRERLA